jgi:peptidoglycan/xylan/chitin deacetylase (PgdA/CDA1 family)
VLLAAAMLVAGCGGGSHPPSTGPPHTTPAPAITDTQIAPVTRPPVPSGPRNAPVPILMYHVVARAPSGTPYPDLWVSPGRFDSEIHALAHAGFHATTLDAVWRAWHGGGQMVRHPVVLSFDDGYQSQSMHARRLLDHLGWPGVLNLEVDNVRQKGGISGDEVRAMMHDGWEIDAHTLTHPDLTTVDPVRLRHEVAGSRQWLQRTFGVPVRFFAYPAGRYDPLVEAEVRRAGFTGATTTAGGIASRHDDRYAMPRIRVTPEMTAAQVVALVRGLRPA